MARLTFIPPFTGTVGPVTIYKMFDAYYIRSRSSLTSKRIKTDPAFGKFLQHAGLMAIASPISSKVYALIPMQRRKRGLRNKITGEAMTWLKYQWTREEIIEYLITRYASIKPPAREGACTILRKDKKMGKLRPGRAPSPVKTAVLSTDLFSLKIWRSRDRKYRRQYNQTFTDYPWSLPLIQSAPIKSKRKPAPDGSDKESS